MSRGKIKQLKRLLSEGNKIIDCLNAENIDLKEKANQYKGTVNELSKTCANFAEKELALHKEIKKMKSKRSFKNKFKKIFG